MLTLWGFVDPLGWLEEEYRWVRLARVGMQVSVVILAMVGWYSWVAHRTREGLRTVLREKRGSQSN